MYNTEIAEVLMNCEAIPFGTGFVVRFSEDQANLADETALAVSVALRNFFPAAICSYEEDPSTNKFALEIEIDGAKHEPVFSPEGIHFLQAFEVDEITSPEDADVWPWIERQAVAS